MYSWDDSLFHDGSGIGLILGKPFKFSSEQEYRKEYLRLLDEWLKWA